MKLICITGIDGAGKTTLVHKVVNRLNSLGKPAVSLYGRTFPVLSRFLMFLGRSTFLRRKNIWKDYPSYSDSKKQVMRNPLLALVFTIAVLLDYFIHIWFKLFFYLPGDRYIVLDRYIYDTIINDLSIHMSYSVEQTRKAIDLGLRLLPKPVLVALIDLPEEVAFSRKNDIPHIDYLRERKRYYLELLKLPEVVCLDGEKEPEEIAADILRKIEQLTPTIAKEPIS